MDPRERIVVDLSALPARPVVRGTRIAVDYLLKLLADGWSEEQIAQTYPGIMREDLEACRRFRA